jgi:hypothetical protein
MVTLRRVGLMSAARVGFWFSVVTNLIFLTIGFVIMILNNVPVTRLPPEMWMQLAIIITLNGLVSSFSAMATAFIYNLIAKSFGGIQMEFEMPDTMTEKRKNGSQTVDIEIEETSSKE